MPASGFAGGKCSRQAEFSGENINITYKPDGTHIAVGNRVCPTVLGHLEPFSTAATWNFLCVLDSE